MQINRDVKTEFESLKELLEVLSPYITTRALARICEISESQMLQYASGTRHITQKKIELINKKLNSFANLLSQFRISDKFNNLD
jgi:DNA helicase HerA-like ATPase